MSWTVLIISFLLAFLLGSIPTAYLFVKKIKGLDIRKVGSGNVGATNAKRVLGWPLAILIFIIDISKGALAAWLIPFLLDWWFPSQTSEFFRLINISGMELLMGMGAFLGHCFTPFLLFRGGKGVATGLGVYLVIVPQATLLTFAVCIIVILATRMMSVASIVGAIVLPLSILAFQYAQRPFPWFLLIMTTLLCVMVIFNHRKNIRRLLQGQEQKI